MYEPIQYVSRVNINTVLEELSGLLPIPITVFMRRLAEVADEPSLVCSCALDSPHWRERVKWVRSEPALADRIDCGR